MCEKKGITIAVHATLPAATLIAAAFGCLAQIDDNAELTLEQGYALRLKVVMERQAEERRQLHRLVRTPPDTPVGHRPCLLWPPCAQVPDPCVVCVQLPVFPPAWVNCGAPAGCGLPQGSARRSTWCSAARTPPAQYGCKTFLSPCSCLYRCRRSARSCTACTSSCSTQK